MREIDASVEKRAKREFARLGEARAARDRRRHDRAQNHRASVGTQLHDLVSGVGGGRRKIGRDHMIERVGFHDCACEGRATRFQRSIVRDQVARDRVRLQPAQADDANAAAPGRRCDGHDGVVQIQCWSSAQSGGNG